MATATENLEAIVESLVEDLALIDTGTYEIDPEYHDSTDAPSAWLEDTLDIEWVQRRSNSRGEWLAGAEILVSTGGPHVHVEWDAETEDFTIIGQWGTAVIKRRTKCGPLHDLLLALF